MKQSDLQALKGLALLRSGKTAESEALMEEIMEAEPTDDPTLQAMTICYREMQKRKNFLKNKLLFAYSKLQCPFLNSINVQVILW